MGASVGCMTRVTPDSARPLTEEEREPVERARQTIDATTDAGPDEDGVHTMGPAVRASDDHPGIRVIVPTADGDASVLVEDLLPLTFDTRAEQS